MIELNGIYDVSRFNDSSLTRRKDNTAADFSEVLEGGTVENQQETEASSEYNALSSEGLIQGDLPDVTTYTFTGKIEVYGKFAGTSVNVEV